MSYLPITILAYLLNSIAVTIDKFLLVKKIPNPLTYIFYISIFSLLILLALPYTHNPTPYTLTLSSASTLLWTTGAYLMFKAIQKWEVTRVVPVIGVLTPLFLLIHAAIFSSISQIQLLAVVVLLLGLTTLNLHTLVRSYIFMEEVVLEIFSALLFAVSYLILREAYLKADFLTVLVYSRLILIPAIIAILLIPKFRDIVLSAKRGSVGLLFIVGQILGGTQQMLLTFSISLATPALVNSLAGVQYVFLFIFSLILSQKYPQIFAEKSSVLIILSKLTGIGLIGIGLYLLAF